MKLFRRLMSLLTSFILALTLLSCSASASDDWTLYNIEFQWQDETGNSFSAVAMPIESSTAAIFWIQIPEDVSISSVSYMISHPDHEYSYSFSDGPSDFLLSYPEQYLPDSANLIISVFDPSNTEIPIDQLQVYFSPFRRRFPSH